MDGHTGCRCGMDKVEIGGAVARSRSVAINGE